MLLQCFVLPSSTTSICIRITAVAAVTVSTMTSSVPHVSGTASFASVVMISSITANSHCYRSFWLTSLTMPLHPTHALCLLLARDTGNNTAIMDFPEVGVFEHGRVVHENVSKGTIGYYLVNIS